jgi:hypothetical protein
VLENTVEALGILGRELTAWLGPATSQENFEVGSEVRAAFLAQDAGAAAHFIPNSVTLAADLVTWRAAGSPHWRHGYSRRKLVHLRGSRRFYSSSARARRAHGAPSGAHPAGAGGSALESPPP